MADGAHIEHPWQRPSASERQPRAGRKALSYAQGSDSPDAAGIRPYDFIRQKKTSIHRAAAAARGWIMQRAERAIRYVRRAHSSRETYL